MPLIEFKCAQGHSSEVIMTFAQAETAKTRECPTCKSRAKRVEFSVTASPAFKGNGWTLKSNQGPRTDVPEHLL